MYVSKSEHAQPRSREMSSHSLKDAGGCKLPSHKRNKSSHYNLPSLASENIHVILCLLLCEAWVFDIVAWPAVDPLDPDLLPLRGSEVTPASICKAPSLPRVMLVMQPGHWSLFLWQQDHYYDGSSMLYNMSPFHICSLNKGKTKTKKKKNTATWGRHHFCFFVFFQIQKYSFSKKLGRHPYSIRKHIRLTINHTLVLF